MSQSSINGKTVYTYPGYRFPGGGFGAGSSADNVQPYPVGVSSYTGCAISCANDSTCRQFILDNYGNCYRMNQAYSYTGGTAGPNVVFPPQPFVSAYVLPYPSNLTNSWNGPNSFTVTCNPNGANLITDIAINIGGSVSLPWTPMTTSGSVASYTVTNANSSNTRYTVIVRNRLPSETNPANASNASNTIQGTTPLSPTYKGSNWTSSSTLQVLWDNKSSNSMVSIYGGNIASGTPISTQDVPASANGSVQFSGLSLNNNYTVMIYNYANLNNGQPGRVLSNGFTVPIIYTTPPASGLPNPIITSLTGSVVDIRYNNARVGSDSSGISNPRYVNSAAECASAALTANGKEYIVSNDSICYVYGNAYPLNPSDLNQWNPTVLSSLPNSFKSGYISTISPPTGVTVTGSGNLSATVSWTAPSSSIPISYQLSYGKVASTGSPLTTAQTLESNSSPLTIDNLDVNSIYAFYVKTVVVASNGSRVFSAASPTQYIQSTIDPPSNVSFTGQNLSMTGSWSVPSFGTPSSYQITYGKVSTTGGAFISTPQVVNTQQTSYQVSNLDYNSMYAAYVKSSIMTRVGTATVLSAASPTQYIQTTYLPSPIAPTLTSVVPGDGQVVVSWSAQQIPQTTLTLYYDTQPIVLNSSGVSNSPNISNISVTSNSQLITGLTNGTIYRFAMVSSNPIGNSPLSNVLAVSPVPALVAPTSAPTVSSPVIGDQKVTLSWNTVSNSSGYKVFYSGTSPVTNSSTSITVQGLTTDVIGLTNGTQYYFAVAALNNAGVGPLSVAVTGTPLPSPPVAPVGLLTTAGDKQGTLTWDSTPSATTYNVYLGTTIPLTEQNKIATTANCSYRFSNLVNGTHYHVSVSSVNSLGQTSPIAAAADLTPVENVPATPANLSVSTDISNFVATWDTVEGATSYNFYYAKNQEMTQDLVKLSVENGTVSQRSPAATGYWGYVTAVNSSGQESNPSPLVAFTTKEVPIPPPGKPTDIKVISGENSVTVSWTAGANNESYTVFYSTDQSFVTDVKSVNTSTTSVMIPNLNANTTYYFNVTGVNGSGHSEPADIITARPVAKVVATPAPGVLQRAKTYIKTHKKIMIILVILFIALLGYLMSRRTGEK